MEPRTIEAAFARFCEQCDPAAMAEVFDRTAPELLPLARRLTRGRLEADDLIQETFLAAIEHRDSFDPSRLLMPWLVGILVRQASSARRRSQRDLDPGRFEAKRESSPDQDAEAHEFQTIVMEALSQLSGRDRAVLVPLLLDGKRAVQIARELGHRPDTIRMRIHRGLDRLRRLLPAGVAMPAYVGSGRGLRDVRANVLSAAARTGSVPLGLPGAGGLSTSTAGLWFSLAFVGSLLLLWRVGSLWSEAQLQAEIPVAEVAADSPSGSDRDVGSPDSDARREIAAGLPEKPAAIALPPGQVWLSGRVLGLESSELARARISVRGLGPDPITRKEPALLADDGSYEVEVTRLFELGARRLLVHVDHPDYLPAEVRVEIVEGRRLSAGSVELLDAQVVEGRVLAQDGTALVGASVGLFSMRAGAQDVLPVDTASTESDGSFHLRTGSAGPHALLAFRSGLRPATALVDLKSAPVAAGELRLEPGLTIAGTLRAPSGTALAGTLVRCEGSKTPGERLLRLADRRFLRIGNSFELATSFAACDAKGAFEFAGLGSQSCDIGVERLAGVDAVAWDPLNASLPFCVSGVRAPRFDVELELPWSVLDFECPAPSPGERAPSRAREELAIDVAVEQEPGLRDPNAINVRLRPAPGSHVRLQVRPGLRYGVALHGCTHRGESHFAIESPAGAASSSIPLELNSGDARSTLALVLGESAVPVGEPIGIGFFPSAGGSAARSVGDEEKNGALFERTATLGVANRVKLVDLPAGFWRVQVRVGGTYARSFGFALPAVLEVDLAPGVSIERNVPLEHGGRARMIVRSSTGAPMTAGARLFDAAGLEHPLHLIALEPESARESLGRVLLDSPSEFGPLRAGAWRLELSALWHETLEFPFEIKVGEVTEFAVQLKAL